MNSRVYLTVLAISLATATDAADVSAGDLPTVDDLYDWSGTYVGIHVDATIGLMNVPDDNSGSTLEGSYDGLASGVFAGHNWVDGNFVYSLEGDLSVGKSLDVGRGMQFILGNTRGGVWDDDSNYEFLLDYSVATRARVGIAFEDALLYGAVGGKALIGRDGFGREEPVYTDRMFLGVTAGAGLEYGLSNSALARVEYDLGLFGDFGGTSILSHSAKVGLAMMLP